MSKETKRALCLAQSGYRSWCQNGSMLPYQLPPPKTAKHKLRVAVVDDDLDEIDLLDEGAA